MRIQVELEHYHAEGEIVLPIHYNRLIQGMIYSLIRERSPEIHDTGFVWGKRTFRLFVFSRLYGKIKSVKNGTIVFQPPVMLKVSSPIENFLSALADGFSHVEKISLGNNAVRSSSVIFAPTPNFTEKETFKAISPVSIYSTLTTPGGAKKTYYYHPQEKEFAEKLQSNLLKKAELLGLENAQERCFEVDSIRTRNTDQKVVYYKNFVVKGWMGIYTLKGDPELLKVAYTCGIGSKNSQGFGMLDLV